MHYTCRHISVPKSLSFFSKHWETEPDDSLIFSKRGHLFGLITLQTENSPNDISQIANQIISNINQNFFTIDSSLFSSRLKFCLEQVQIRWSDYQPSILLVAICNQTMATSYLGQASLLLKRHQQFSQIISSSSSQLQLITGPVQDNDLLFLSHPGIIDQITNLSDFFNLDSLDSQEEFLTNQISNPVSASLFVQIHYPTESSTASPQSPQLQSVFSDQTQLPVQKRKLTSFFNKIFTQKPTQITHHPLKHDQAKKKLNIIIGILATIGLIVSIAVGAVKKNQTDKLNQFNSLESQLISSLDTINRVRSLNMEDAQSEAQKTIDLINQMSTLKLFPQKVQDYQSQIDTILSQTGSADHTKLDKLYDTSLITNNPSYSKIIFVGNQFYLLDNTKGRLDNITITSGAKSNQHISADSLTKNTIAINLFKSSVFALTPNDLYQVSKTNWSKQFSSEENTYISLNSWGSSVYLLQQNTILRSALVNNALSDPTVWLESDQNLPKDPVDLSIDSRIWVLSKSGQINVYLRGKKDNFTLSSPPSTSTASNLIVAQDKDLLLFLADSNTVVVYTKQGELLSKYNLKDYDIKSIALDEDNSILYLLASDQAIYKLAL